MCGECVCVCVLLSLWMYIIFGVVYIMFAYLRVCSIVCLSVFMFLCACVFAQGYLNYWNDENNLQGVIAEIEEDEDEAPTKKKKKKKGTEKKKS